MKIKNFVKVFMLTLVLSCSQNKILSIVNQKQQNLYTEAQRQSSFTNSLFKYRKMNRDTIFKKDIISKDKDFILIERSSSVNGNYSGCLLSNDKIGFSKDSYQDKMEFYPCDYDEEFINFISSADNSLLTNCSIKYPVFDGATFFVSKNVKGKLTVYKFQEFDFESCR